VLIAYLRNALLPVFKQYRAKPVPVQKWTLTVLLLYVMLAVLARDVLANPAVKRFLVIVGAIIYLDVPAHAAAVVTAR
jgi:hypothetical protein